VDTAGAGQNLTTFRTRKLIGSLAGLVAVHRFASRCAKIRANSTCGGQRKRPRSLGRVKGACHMGRRHANPHGDLARCWIRYL